jgi:poly-gamma-glutamate synthesis protein (capsule biosynthesis protein)
MSSTVDLMCVGDLILSAENASSYFDHVRSRLAAADVAVAQVEWPHTDRGQVCTVDIPAPAAPPANLDAVAECGFEVATLASNHMFDQGPWGVIDTIEHLHARDVQTVGAGATVADARAPVIVERNGLRLGFLSYNAVGPRESWATEVKAGVAPVRVFAHYELDIASPGSPPTEYTSLESDSVAAMQADIAQLAADTDYVVVSLHKGMGFVHAQLAEYERPLARLAVDAGADVVIGHHAHILRGVEVYKGRPIFHGINHFVTAYTDETDPLSRRARRPRPRRAPSLDFFTPDREVEHFPFPRDSRHTMIARVLVDQRGVQQAGFVPCYINERAQPVPVTEAAGSDATTDYIKRITADAGLEATFAPAGDWVTVLNQSA